jgi:hypothetical protein
LDALSGQRVCPSHISPLPVGGIQLEWDGVRKALLLAVRRRASYRFALHPSLSEFGVACAGRPNVRRLQRWVAALDLVMRGALGQTIEDVRHQFVCPIGFDLSSLSGYSPDESGWGEPDGGLGERSTLAGPLW